MVYPKANHPCFPDGQITAVRWAVLFQIPLNTQKIQSENFIAYFNGRLQKRGLADKFTSLRDWDYQ